MTANLQEEVNHIVEVKIRATRLDNLIQGYRLCARTEGKSEKTIRITTTALTTLRNFLEARQYPADVTEIGANELRERPCSTKPNLKIYVRFTSGNISPYDIALCNWK